MRTRLVVGCGITAVFALFALFASVQRPNDSLASPPLPSTATTVSPAGTTWLDSESARRTSPPSTSVVALMVAPAGSKGKPPPITTTTTRSLAEVCSSLEINDAQVFGFFYRPIQCEVVPSPSAVFALEYASRRASAEKTRTRRRPAVVIYPASATWEKQYIFDDIFDGQDLQVKHVVLFDQDTEYHNHGQPVLLPQMPASSSRRFATVGFGAGSMYLTNEHRWLKLLNRATSSNSNNSVVQDDDEDNNSTLHVLVIQTVMPLTVLQYMLRAARPSICFALSDESGSGGAHIAQLLSLSCKVVFVQYSNSNIMQGVSSEFVHKLHFIPLGTGTGLFPPSSSSAASSSSSSLAHLIPSSRRKLKWMFAGSVHYSKDRDEMLKLFSEWDVEKFLHIVPKDDDDVFAEVNAAEARRAGRPLLSTAAPTTVAKSVLREKLVNARFAPVGRGRLSLNCFKIYEACRAGAIPVIVGEATELADTFPLTHNFTDSGWIVAASWTAALRQVRKLDADPVLLDAMQQRALKFWSSSLDDIRHRIRHEISS